MEVREGKVFDKRWGRLKSGLYILQHEAEYIYKSETELKLKKSLLECSNKGVKADEKLAWYNTPELFLEEV